MKELSEKKAPKPGINIVDRECGGPYSAKAFSGMPANRQQVYNLKRGKGQMNIYRGILANLLHLLTLMTNS